MNKTTKEAVRNHLQSIAILAVQAQTALYDEDFAEMRDLLDSIAYDLERVETIGKELLEME